MSDHVDTPQASVLLGLAHRDVTPPVGIYHRMWGAATHDRAEGVHRPLRVTAVALGALDDPAERLALLAIDHCLLMPREVETLLERLTREDRAHAVGRDRIVVTFSHTHAAGLLDLDRADLPGGELLAPYFAELVEGCAGALAEALDAAAPADLVFGAGRCSLATNRDFHDAARGIWVCGLDPDTPADDTVVVARATDASGAPMATFVNYACHPTTLGPGNTLISPDYPGAAREVVERETGCPCVFFQGASGDLGPRDGYVADPAVADRNGRELGFAALAAIEALPPAGTRCRYRGPLLSGATLGIWEHEPLDEGSRRAAARWRLDRVTVPLSYRPDLPALDEARASLERWQAAERSAAAEGDEPRIAEARAMAERMRRLAARLERLPPGRSYPYEVTLWRSGDAVWIAAPGEPYSLLQRELRARFDTPIVVIGLTGGWGPSYLPSTGSWGRGIYQETIAVTERGSLERVIERVASAIADL